MMIENFCLACDCDMLRPTHAKKKKKRLQIYEQTFMKFERIFFVCFQFHEHRPWYCERIFFACSWLLDLRDLKLFIFLQR